MGDKFVFKKDNFRDARGTSSRFLNIYCDHCGLHILLYQKDGPGPLKRLYLDRIFAPKELSGLQDSDLENIPDLECIKCKRVVAIPFWYEKEKRKAYRLFSYSFIKKIGKGIYPPTILQLKVD